MAFEAGNATGIIGLAAGVTSAVATITVALVNARHSRRDLRDNLKRDVELAKQLQDGSAAKNILERYVTRQILVMAVDTYTTYTRGIFFLFYTLLQGGLIMHIVITALSADEHKLKSILTQITWFAGVMWVVLGVLRHQPALISNCRQRGKRTDPRTASADGDNIPGWL